MKTLQICALLMLCSLPICAQSADWSGFDNAGKYKAKTAKVSPGAKIFIAPMQGDLHQFLAAEIVKKKVPIIVVTEEKAAEFILTGASIRGDDKWYHVIFGGKDKNEGSVQLISVKEKAMVWAGEAGDRSLWWGSLSRGGQRKVADRIIARMKSDLFK
jgi:hypothetical protein